MTLFVTAYLVGGGWMGSSTCASRKESTTPVRVFAWPSGRTRLRRLRAAGRRTSIVFSATEILVLRIK
jgi:hypothetical protein